MTGARTGRCLCGAVRWSTSSPLRQVLECHCVRCQRFTGHFMAATAVPTGELRIDGDTLRWFAPEDDPNVTYGFCERCGSSLFYRAGVLDETNESTSICVGSIDGRSGLRTEAVWFADDAADHVRLDDSIVRYGAEPPGV